MRNGIALAILALTLKGPVHAWEEPAAPAHPGFFAVQVVDSETGRGVPMVELITVNHRRFVTDSAGWIAFHEPGLMNREVYFHIKSHGYEVAKDGFGFQGVRLTPVLGKLKKVSVRRINIAERQYRITGEGIYRDSLLLGLDVPLEQPVINGGVLGQDTVQTAIHAGKAYWFWGDTNSASYPLGQFKTSGATSLLPGQGALDPSVGINLEYFVDNKGFSRQMAPLEGEGVVWLHGLFVLKQPNEPDRMVAHYARLRSLTERLEHGLVLFNDKTQTFERVVRFDDSAPLYPRGQAFTTDLSGQEYIYFATPFPSVRVAALWDDITDPTKYQAYTCLKAGTRYDAANPTIDRDAQGNVVWDWKLDTDTIDGKRQQELIENGHLTAEQSRFVLRGPQSEPLVYAHAGSAHWNAYRNKWIMVCVQAGGSSSYLGEVWYAESAMLEGPWENARKIVTHDKYTFYNPAHHPFMDQEGGRFIYFEGTFAETFSGAKFPLFGYDYNQIMYRLDLAHPRLELNTELHRR